MHVLVVSYPVEFSRPNISSLSGPVVENLRHCLVAMPGDNQSKTKQSPNT